MNINRTAFLRYIVTLALVINFTREIVDRTIKYLDVRMIRCHKLSHS